MKNLWIVLFFLSLLACQSKPVLKGTGTLYVRYEQAEKKIKAEAVFTETDEKGVEKPKVIQGGVSFLGGGMETRNMPGNKLRYEYERFGNLPEELPFRFKEPSGKEIKFVLKMSSPGDFGFQDSTLRKSKTCSLVWKGTALGNSEKLVLIFTDAANLPHSLEFYGPTSGPSVSITPDKLLKFSPGVAQFYLVRIDAGKREEQGYSIFCQTEFYTAAKTVMLEE